jgi:DNA-binding PadR family transcriptional regulator
MEPNQNEILAKIPLTETTYFILLSLAPGPRHGYAIMKDVRSLSHGRVALSTGTLYSALKRLLDDGWIDRAEGPGGPTDGRGRKDYRLTLLGQRILEAEVQRLQGLVSAARLSFLGSSARPAD